MPANKKQKYRLNYSFDMLREAYRDVTIKKFTIRKAAKLHNLPESTLRFRLGHPEGAEAKSGGPTLFTKLQEEQLAEHCISMAHVGYGFARWQILEMARNMCGVVGKGDTEPTKHWFYGFLQRFPELSMVRPKKRERARDIAVTEDMVNRYFDQLKLIMEKYALINKPENIWNVDESGISLDHSPPKILARSGTNPHAVTHGRSPTTTLIAGVSAIGETLPPYVIFKGGRVSTEMKTCAVQGTVYRTSQSGWSNSILFLDFFQNHFLRHIVKRPILLLYDGHSTHINAEIIEVARENDVHLFVLPPHSSHCLQPLNVSVFSPFKCSLNSQIHRYMHNNPNSIVTKEELPRFIGCAYQSSLSVSTIMSGFRKTGIFPFDRTAPSVTPPTITKKTESKAATRGERKDNRHIKILFQEKSANFAATATPEKISERKRKAFVPPYGCAVTEDDKYEEKKERNQKKSAKEQEKPGISRKRKSFQVPFKSKETEPAQISGNCTAPNCSGKKKSKSSDEGKKGKGPLKKSKKGKSAYKAPAKSQEIDNDTDNELCTVCGRWQPEGLNLHLGIRFVQWGQCSSCDQWVHLKFCTDVENLAPEDDFLCPRCTHEQ